MREAVYVTGSSGLAGSWCVRIANLSGTNVKGFESKRKILHLEYVVHVELARLRRVHSGGTLIVALMREAFSALQRTRA